MAAAGGAVVIQIGKGTDIAYLAHQAATPRTQDRRHQRKKHAKRIPADARHTCRSAVR
jgi:hypothetical protein